MATPLLSKAFYIEVSGGSTSTLGVIVPAPGHKDIVGQEGHGPSEYKLSTEISLTDFQPCFNCFDCKTAKVQLKRCDCTMVESQTQVDS